MTTAELDALAGLEEQIERLAVLVRDQGRMLRKQEHELQRLRADKAELQRQLQQAVQEGQMAEVAQGLVASSDERREQALSYLASIIEDVRASIRQLELE